MANVEKEHMLAVIAPVLRSRSERAILRCASVYLDSLSPETLRTSFVIEVRFVERKIDGHTWHVFRCPEFLQERLVFHVSVSLRLEAPLRFRFCCYYSARFDLCRQTQTYGQRTHRPVISALEETQFLVQLT